MSENNVVSMFDRPKKPNKVREEEDDFAAVMEKNKQNEERVARERARANKSVCRSHRLNNNKR